MSGMADLVGWIIGERPDGYYRYGCGEHTPAAIRRESHRAVLREEATEDGATCEECGYELAEAEALDA